MKHLPRLSSCAFFCCCWSLGALCLQSDSCFGLPRGRNLVFAVAELCNAPLPRGLRDSRSPGSSRFEVLFGVESSSVPPCGVPGVDSVRGVGALQCLQTRWIGKIDGVVRRSTGSPRNGGCVVCYVLLETCLETKPPSPHGSISCPILLFSVLCSIPRSFDSPVVVLSVFVLPAWSFIRGSSVYRWRRFHHDTKLRVQPDST